MSKGKVAAQRPKAEQMPSRAHRDLRNSNVQLWHFLDNPFAILELCNGVVSRHSSCGITPATKPLPKRAIASRIPASVRSRRCLMAIYRKPAAAASAGQAIGILMLDCRLPFIPGDVGNASSYSYPVVYKTVPGLSTAVCLAGAPVFEE